MSSCQNLTIQGSITSSAGATGCCSSGRPGISIPLSESLNVKLHTDEYTLEDNTEVTVSFGAITNAHFLYLKAVGGKIQASVTSSDGTDQAVPVEGLWILTNRTVPLTALKITRDSSLTTDVTVYVVLGEIPS